MAGSWADWKPGDPIPPGPPPDRSDPLGLAHYNVAVSSGATKGDQVGGPGTTVSSKGANTQPGDKATGPTTQRTPGALEQHLSTGATGTPLSSLLNEDSKPTEYGGWQGNVAPGTPVATGNTTPPSSQRSGYTPYAPTPPAPRAASGPYLAGDLVNRTIGIDATTRVDPYSGQRYTAANDGTWRASGFVGRDEMAGLRTAGAMPPVAETVKNDTANSVAMSANPALRAMGGTAGLLGNLLPTDAPHFSSLGDFRLPGVGFNAADYKPMNTPNLDNVRLQTPVAQRPYGQDFGSGAPGAKSSGPGEVHIASQSFQVPNDYRAGPSGFSIPDNGGAFKAFAMPFGIQSPTFSALTQSAPAQIQPNATRDPATGSWFSPVGPGLPMGAGMERQGGAGAAMLNGPQTVNINGGGLGMGFNPDTILKDYGRDNVSQDAATRAMAALALMDKNSELQRSGMSPLDAYMAMNTASSSNYGAPVASFPGAGGGGNAGSTAAGAGAYGPDGPDRGFSKGGTVNVRGFAKGGAVSTLPMGGQEYPFGGESSSASTVAPPPEFGAKNGQQQAAPQPVATGPTQPALGVQPAAPNPVQQALNPAPAPAADPNTPTFNNPAGGTPHGGTVSTNNLGGNDNQPTAAPGGFQATTTNPNGDPNTVHPAQASADQQAAPATPTAPDLSPYQNALTKLSIMSRQRNAGLTAYKQGGLAAPTGVDSIGDMNVDQLPAGDFYDPSSLIQGRVGDIVNTQKSIDALGNPSDPSTYLSQLAPIDQDLARYNQAQGIQTKLQGLGAPEDLQGLLTQQNTLQSTLSRLQQARDIQTKLSGIGQTGDLGQLGSQIAALQSSMAPYQAVQDLINKRQALGDVSGDPAQLEWEAQYAANPPMDAAGRYTQNPDPARAAQLHQQAQNIAAAQQISAQISNLDPSGQAVQKLGELGAQLDQLKQQQGNWQSASDLRNTLTNQLSGLVQPGEDVPGALATSQAAMSPLQQRIANAQQNADLRSQYGNQLSGLVKPGEDIATALGQLQGQRGAVQLNLDNANKAMGLHTQMGNLLSLGVPGAGKLPGFAGGGQVNMVSGYNPYKAMLGGPSDVARAQWGMPSLSGLPPMRAGVPHFKGGGSMVTPEPIVGIGTQTGKPRFIVGEPQKPGGPPMAERLSFPSKGKLKIKPLNRPASLPMGGGRAAA